jgi:hypothetical protein
VNSGLLFLETSMKSIEDFYHQTLASTACNSLSSGQEALVQDYDGLIRIVPAIPPGWDFDGSVYVRGKTKVDVQTRNGVVTAVEIEAGMPQHFRIRIPWSNETVDVISADSGKAPISASGPTIQFDARSCGIYALVQHKEGRASFELVSGRQATSAKRLGRVQIGLFRDDH